MPPFILKFKVTNEKVLDITKDPIIYYRTVLQILSVGNSIWVHVHLAWDDDDGDDCVPALHLQRLPQPLPARHEALSSKHCSH